MGDYLNDRYLQYLKGQLSFQSIKEEVILATYQIIKSKLHLKEDDLHELLLSFYPRINDIILKYRKGAKKFYNYLILMLNYHYKDFNKRKLRKSLQYIIDIKTHIDSYEKEMNDETFDQDLIQNNIKTIFQKTPGANCKQLEVYDNEQTYTKNIKTKVKKQMTILLLKQHNRMNASEINQFSELFDLPKIKINHYILLGEIMTYDRKMKYRSVCEIRNNRFNKLQLLRHKLITEESEYRQTELVIKIKTEENQVDSLNARIRKIKLDPSNKEIANILGIPKGTVDSVLYHLGKKSIYCL